MGEYIAANWTGVGEITSRHPANLPTQERLEFLKQYQRANARRFMQMEVDSVGRALRKKRAGLLFQYWAVRALAFVIAVLKTADKQRG